MLELLLNVFWLLLPAGVANLVPPLGAKFLPLWDAPVDFAIYFRNRRLFGANKTWRGILLGLGAGAVVYQLQIMLGYNFDVIRSLELFSYNQHHWFGVLSAAGALGGDLVKSLIKRQLEIAPGRPWFPFDQLDWVAGVLLVIPFYASLDAVLVLFSLVLGAALSLLFKALGYLLHVNQKAI